MCCFTSQDRSISIPKIKITDVILYLSPFFYTNIHNTYEIKHCCLHVDAFKILPDFNIFIQFHWNLCCCIHVVSPFT